MGRSPCCSKEGLNKGAWTALEDKILKSYIKAHGEGNWRNLPKRAGLKRCGKSCRLRWLNYLRPDIKRGNISGDEEELIIRLHKLLGNRWSLIAGRLPGRTDNEIKNYWNTTLGKKAKLAQQSSSPSPPILSNNNNKHSTNSQARNNNNNNNNNRNEAKVIRTKATRCSTKVVVVQPSPTTLALPLPSATHDQTSPPATVEPILISDLAKQARDENSYRPVNDDETLVASRDDVQRLCDAFGGRFGAAGGDGVDHDDQKWEKYFNANLSIEDLGPSLPFDEPVFDDWVPSAANYGSCPDQEEYAALDLESLAFLLDSEEWP